MMRSGGASTAAGSAIKGSRPRPLERLHKVTRRAARGWRPWGRESTGKGVDARKGLRVRHRVTCGGVGVHMSATLRPAAWDLRAGVLVTGRRFLMGVKMPIVAEYPCCGACDSDTYAACTHLPTGRAHVDQCQPLIHNMSRLLNCPIARTMENRGVVDSQTIISE